MQDTYQATGNVPQADVDLLNQAIANASLAQSMENSNPSQALLLAQKATSIANGVSQNLNVVKENGQSQNQTNDILFGAFVVALLALAFVIYKFGPDSLWKLWLRQRKSYSVKIQAAVPEPKKTKTYAEKGDDEGSDEPLFTIDNVCKIIAALLVVIAVASVSYSYISGRPGEQFSQLGMLGPSQNLTDYPTEVVAGSTVNLYAYVGNNLGAPTWYSVLVKVGDNSTQVNPDQEPSVTNIDQILLPNSNLTVPVNVTMVQTGINQRIIFELWEFNTTTGSFQYSGLWDQVWLNVTSAPL
jgi:hypothetical protein